MVKLLRLQHVMRTPFHWQCSCIANFSNRMKHHRYSQFQPCQLLQSFSQRLLTYDCQVLDGGPTFVFTKREHIPASGQASNLAQKVIQLCNFPGRISPSGAKVKYLMQHMKQQQWPAHQIKQCATKCTASFGLSIYMHHAHNCCQQCLLTMCIMHSTGGHLKAGTDTCSHQPAPAPHAHLQCRV